MSALLERILLEDEQKPLHAFPSVDNVASNALCGSLGFELHGEVEVEYPKGRHMRANDWGLDARTQRAGGRA